MIKNKKYLFHHNLDFHTLLEKYTQVNAAFEYSFDGIMITNKEGLGVKVNNALLRLTGLEEEHLIGKKIIDLKEKGLVKYEPLTSKALREKCVFTGKQEIYTGKEIIVSAVPVFDNTKELLGVATNVRDLVELHRLAENYHKTRELSPSYEPGLDDLQLELIKSKKIIAQSQKMLSVMETAFYVATSDVNVVILGESGVGKEIIAQLIHDNSSRREKGAFIKVNCGAIPYELMESEFFGYERGAFTGARNEGKKGFFELAHGGTLFLDEIADLPVGLQVKLLRVLEDKEVFRIGGEKPIKFDARIISATNKDLETLVVEGSFREDLYYRLNVVPINLPPLRERREDVSALLEHFLHKFNQKYNVQKSFSQEALHLLLNYNWPGNVRELINFVERLVITTRNPTIFPENFPRSMNIFSPDYSPSSSLLLEHRYLKEQLSSRSMKDVLDEIEKKIMEMAFKEHRSSRKVGEVLGVSHATVINKLRKHGIIE